MPEENSVFIEYGVKAVKEHIKFQDESIVPGYVGFVSDVDVNIEVRKIVLPAGLYLLKAGEDINEAHVFIMTFDADELVNLGNDLDYEETVDDEGVITRMIREPVSFSAKVEPVPIGDGKSLTYLEYVAWLAIQTAESEEQRKEIFNDIYILEEKADGTPKQGGRRASRRYDPVTKLHQNMSNPALYGDGGVALDVAGKGERKKGKTVKTLVSLEYVGDDESLELTRKVSEFDMQVYNAIASLYEAGKTEFTLQEIFNLTMGKGKAKQSQLDVIADSVELLRRTRLKADVTQEAKAHKLIDPETGEPWAEMKIDDFIFNALRIQMKSTNGKITTGYKVHTTPILSRYAKASKQIVSYPTRYLDTKEAGSNTQRNIVIRGYLLQRIAQAKGGKMSPTIRYEAIYDKAGVDKTNATARNRANDYIEGLMQVWTKQGFITGYKVEKEARQIAKVTVFFPDRKK